MTVRSHLVVQPLPTLTATAGVRVEPDQRRCTLAKDATLLRLLDSAASPSGAVGHSHPNSSNGRTNAALLGPLVSTQLTFDHIHQVDAVVGGGGTAVVADKQAALYAATIQPVVRRAIDGRNGCIINYGATNSKKVDTVAGDDDTRGLMGLAIDELFTSAQRRSDSRQLFQLAATLVHVHNDHLRDLLYSDGTQLKLVTNEEGTSIVGCRRVRLKARSQLDELVQLFRTSCRARNVHTVLTLHVEHLDLTLAMELSATGQQSMLPQCVNKVSTVQFVDLASVELSLAGAPGFTATGSTHFPSGQPFTSFGAAAHDSTAARRHSKDPTLVKQALGEMRARERQFLQTSTREKVRIAPPTTMRTHQANNVYVPTSEYEQKALSKSFEALEHVLFQLLSKPPPSSSLSAASAARSHISYRSSKLTWLLSDTLSSAAHCDVLVLSYISPLVSHLDTAMHVTRFGSKVAEWSAKRRAKEHAAANAKAASAAAGSGGRITAPRMPSGDMIESYLDGTMEEEPSPPPQQASSSGPGLSDIPIAMLYSRHPPQTAAPSTARSLLTARHAASSSPPPPPSTSSNRPPSTSSAHYPTPATPARASPAFLSALEHNNLDEYLARTPHPRELTTATPAERPSVPMSIVPEHTEESWRREQQQQLQHQQQQRQQETEQHQRQQQQQQQEQYQLQQEEKYAEPTRAASSNVVPTASALPSPRTTDPTSSTSHQAINLPPAASTVSPCASSSSLSSSPRVLPDRLFDVLDVFRTARFGARADTPAADWPYKKDVILKELVDQLTAWQQQQTEDAGAGGPCQQAHQRPTSFVTADVARAAAGPTKRVQPLAASRIPVRQASTSTNVAAATATATPLTFPQPPHRTRSHTDPHGDAPSLEQLAASSTHTHTPQSLSAESTPIPTRHTLHHDGADDDQGEDKENSLPSGSSGDPWLSHQLASVKAEMHQLTSELMRLSGQLPPHSADGSRPALNAAAAAAAGAGVDEKGAPQPLTPAWFASDSYDHDHGHMPSPAHQQHPHRHSPQDRSDSVTVSPGARSSPVGSALSATATYRDSRGYLTHFAVRPASVTHAMHHSVFTSPPLASLPFGDSPSPSQTTTGADGLAHSTSPPSLASAFSLAHTPGPPTAGVGVGVGGLATPPSRPWLETTFNSALRDQLELHSTLKEAERMVRQRQQQQHYQRQAQAGLQAH